MCIMYKVSEQGALKGTFLAFVPFLGVQLKRKPFAIQEMFGFCLNALLTFVTDSKINRSTD